MAAVLAPSHWRILFRGPPVSVGRFFIDRAACPAPG